MRQKESRYAGHSAVLRDPDQDVFREHGIAHFHAVYEVFRPLQDEALFRCVHADSHGDGVIWNDEIDLAESEVWINGRVVEPSGALDEE